PQGAPGEDPLGAPGASGSPRWEPYARVRRSRLKMLLSVLRATVTPSHRSDFHMDRTVTTPGAMKGFREMRRKAVDVSAASLVQAAPLRPDQTLPLVARPAVAQVDLAEWAQGNLDFLQAHLLKHGAILFRGFGLDSVRDFERVALAMCPQLFSEYGDLPREG